MAVALTLAISISSSANRSAPSASRSFALNIRLARTVSHPRSELPKDLSKWSRVFDQTACNSKTTHGNSAADYARINATGKTTRHQSRRLPLRHLRHLHRHSTSLTREAV